MICYFFLFMSMFCYVFLYCSIYFYVWLCWCYFFLCLALLVLMFCYVLPPMFYYNCLVHMLFDVCVKCAKATGQDNVAAILGRKSEKKVPVCQHGCLCLLQNALLYVGCVTTCAAGGNRGEAQGNK